MIALPGDTPAHTISGIIADEAAIGMINSKPPPCHYSGNGQNRRRQRRVWRPAGLRARDAGQRRFVRSVCQPRQGIPRAGAVDEEPICLIHKKGRLKTTVILFSDDPFVYLRPYFQTTYKPNSLRKRTSSAQPDLALTQTFKTLWYQTVFPYRGELRWKFFSFSAFADEARTKKRTTSAFARSHGMANPVKHQSD